MNNVVVVIETGKFNYFKQKARSFPRFDKLIMFAGPQKYEAAECCPNAAYRNSFHDDDTRRKLSLSLPLVDGI